MTPYNEQFHLTKTGPQLMADYAAAGRKVGDDAAWVVWPARIERDVCDGMTYEASLAKHRAEWQASLNPQPVPPVGPFKPAPRDWRGNMCGVRIGGLPPVDGGAGDASLVLSWFYDRYDAADRLTIRSAWRAKGYTHVLLSWPDSRDFGQSPQQFLNTCMELIAAGFYPCVMLSSKDHDPADVTAIVNALMPVLGLLVGVVPMFCMGWELSLWLSPTQVQQLTDLLAPLCLKQPGTLTYVHFQQGYMSFPQPDHDNASYWKQQVGKLHGVLAQKKLEQDDAAFLDWISDCLVRMAGQFNMPTDSGFGHPFDFVMLEISAQQQFNGQMNEAEGDRLGRLAINAPPCSGPAGTVKVMGSGNGA